MPRKLRELRAELRRAGWRLERQTGSHQTWRHSRLPGINVRLAGSDGDDAKPYQESNVARALDSVKETTQE